MPKRLHHIRSVADYNAHDSNVRQLRYSEKSVKEIAGDLDFPNLSFFGKFVREHLGMSPTDYRARKLNEA